MKVKPIIVYKVPLSDVEIGEVFSFNGIRYIKLADGDDFFDDISAITFNPVAYININDNQDISVEQKVFAKYRNFVINHKHNDLIASDIPDADMYREYINIIKTYVDEDWYIDNGENDGIQGNEFFYADKFADLRKGCPDKPIALHTVEKLGVRVVHYFEPYATVFVKK